MDSGVGKSQQTDKLRTRIRTNNFHLSDIFLLLSTFITLISILFIIFPPYKTWSNTSLGLKLMLSLLFAKGMTVTGFKPRLNLDHVL
jgi:hypothetical protein